MAISVAQSGSASGTLPTNSISTSLTVTEASNQTLYVAIVIDTTASQNPTVTFNGDTVTQISEASGTGEYLWVGYLANPDSGSSMTLSASGTFPGVGWALIWAVVNENDQTTPYDSGTVQLVQSASAATSSATTTSETNDLVLAFISVNNKGTSGVNPSGSGQTQITELVSGENAVYAGSSYTAGAASVTTTWGWSGNTAVTQIAMNLNVASGSSDTPITVTKADLQPTGQTITLNQTWSTSVTKADLQPSASSLVLNQSAVLTQADLQPTGQDITLTWVNPWTIAVDKADLQPAGQSIALNQSWSIAVDKADLQPAGQDITLSWTQTGLVAVDSAAFTIDGQTIAFDLSSVVDVASPSISGSIVDLVLTASTTEQPSGGWVESEYERRYAQINDEIRRELEAEKEREELAERLERVLVQEGTLTQAQADLIRLRGVAGQYNRSDLPNRARRALAFAERAQSELATKLALREIRRLEEEEEYAVLLLMALD